MRKLGSESLNRNVSVINEISNDNNKEFVSSRDKLVCFYVNARSIEMSELEVYVYEEQPDIIGITESWTFKDLQNSELNIYGYILLRKDRIVGDKVSGGGVMLYIKSTLNATVSEDHASKISSECIWCDVEIENENTLIRICYRCPSSNKLSDETLFE